MWTGLLRTGRLTPEKTEQAIARHRRGHDAAGATHLRPARHVVDRLGEAPAPLRDGRPGLARRAPRSTPSAPSPPSGASASTRPIQSGPAVGVGRRGPPAADRLEPALERGQVHARGRPRDAAARDARRAGAARRRGHRRGHRAGVPAARLRALLAGRHARARAGTEGSAWASRSSAIWWPRTAGRSPWRARAAGRGTDVRRHAAAAVREQVAEADAVPREPTPPDTVLAGIEVLVVEDDRSAREAIATVLGRYGATVEAVDSAAAARDALARRRVDILLTDLAMPEEDGYQLVAQLRRRGIGIPAAALTSFAGDEPRRRARALGFGAYLTKPVDPAELVAALATLAHVSRRDRFRHEMPVVRGEARRARRTRGAAASAAPPRGGAPARRARGTRPPCARAPASPAPPPRCSGSEVQLVDERVAAAVLEAVAEGQRRIADDLAGGDEHPHASERRVAEEARERRPRLRRHERIAVLGVVPRHQREDAVAVVGTRGTHVGHGAHAERHTCRSPSTQPPIGPAAATIGSIEPATRSRHEGTHGEAALSRGARGRVPRAHPAGALPAASSDAS